MKEFLNKKALIIVLSLVLLIVFVFGGMYSRYMTNQIDVHVQERYELSLVDMVDDGSSLVAFDSNGVDKLYTWIETGEDYQPTLLESYKVLNDSDEEVAIIYVIQSNGKYEGLVAAYAISLETNYLLSVQAISSNETTSVEGEYYNLITDDFFTSFVNKDMDVIDYSIDSVAGATYSSLGFEVGMKYARELYVADTDFEYITLVLSIDSLTYNYDLATLNDYTFIAEITFGANDDTATVGLNNSLEYVSTISGTDPTASEIEAMPSYVAEAGLMNTQVTVSNYDSSTGVITLVTKGYSNSGITIDVQLNGSLDAISQVSLNTSNESYDNDYNGGYSGPSVPSVENGYIDDYNLDGTIIDSTAGATVSSNAMTAALNWVDALDAALNGGN